ncbi:ERF family protein [Paenibacillus sp. FSL K6-1217]|uniref:ERF family protein n=1 Tax=Paenibacillus sp. FSL K6-1217 TaxID=2921466 RepID=UPI00324404D7
MNIYQKLIEVRKEVPYIQKADQGAQYSYTGSSRVLAAVTSKMNELGLLLVPAVVGHKLHESPIEFKDTNGNVTKRTTTYFTEVDMTMTWINAEKPDEQIVSPWYGQGVDIAGEKGVGKALTYAEKYFMLKFFNIPTDKDDPDAFQQKHDLVSMISSEQIGKAKVLWLGLGLKEADMNKQTTKLYKKTLTQLTEELATDFIAKLEAMKTEKESS